jgi:transcriptional regulator with XRE-family HTH domain
MTSPPGGPASPAQIARNGHVAALLRTQMAQRNWTARDFNARMGLEVTHTSIYVWLNAKGAPGPTTRPKVAKLLGVAEAQLMPRDAARDPLVFRVTAGGEAHIRLDVTLPMEEGSVLLRMLLDMGNVIRAGA